MIGENSEVLHPQDTPQNTLSHSNYLNNTRPTSTEENIKHKTRTPPNCPGQLIQDKSEKLPQIYRVRGHRKTQTTRFPRWDPQTEKEHLWENEQTLKKV